MIVSSDNVRYGEMHNKDAQRKGDAILEMKRSNQRKKRIRIRTHSVFFPKAL
jgi:hypothetical protein